MPKKILLLSHDASRTGAPIALLHLLEWLRGHTDWEFTVLLGEGGDLQPRFEVQARTLVWDLPAETRLLQRVIDGVRSRLGAPRNPRKHVLRQLAAEGFDGVYAASAVTARLIPPLRPYVPAPVLCHVCELEYILRRYVKTQVFRTAQPFVKHYLAVSEATRQNLIDRHGVRPADVTRVYECLPARRYRAEAAHLRPAETRAALGIPADAYVVASGGTLQWRKGPDLFLQVGRRLLERAERPFFLLWVGGPTRGEEYERVCYEADHLGLSERLRVTGLTDGPLTYLAAADVFLLTSREEPFAVICLEAAVLERPVVCFDGAGGIPELLVGGRGSTVPYADTLAMAAVVAQLWADPASAAATARRLADYVTEQNDVDVVGAQIEALIKRHLLAEL